MPDTYDKRCQLGASRCRFKDAVALHGCKRWLGAIYLGGYAIECSLKSFICYEEGVDNFKETSAFKKGLTGKSLHNLAKLLDEAPELKRIISLDRTHSYRDTWKTITSAWKNDELRYSYQPGLESDSQEFIEAVRKWHKFLLNKQGVAS